MQCGKTEEVGLLRDINWETKGDIREIRKKKDNTFLMIIETMDPVLWVLIEYLTLNYIKSINILVEIVFIYLELLEK